MYFWLNNNNFFSICLIWIAIAIAVHITMFFIRAPFGRHTRKGFGPLINNRLGWILMEAPSFFITLYFFIQTKNPSTTVIIIYLFWLLHYFNRSFVFPFRIKSYGKKIPVFIVINAILFNYMNAGLNGYYLCNMTTERSFDIFYFIGLLLFVLGVFINVYSDEILMKLRKPGETDYKIPQGFLFRYVSCPNLLGEVIEWLGFALMAFNPAAFSFFIWTCANLIPRAKNHHDWYLEKFADYPRERKVIFPKLF